MRRTALPLFVLASFLLPGAPALRGQPNEDEILLREAKLATDGPSLVAFFKKRILPENDAAKVKELIGQLGSDRFNVREKASETLVAMGPGVAKALRDSVSDPDPEVAHRVKDALEIVERTSTVPILSAAARVLSQRKPPEAARVLLDFTPVNENEEVIEAIRLALIGVARRDGKPEPALVEALKDKQPLRRSLAADVLIRTEGLDGPAARKLLADTDPQVRLRTALALVERNDKQSIPALIALLPALKLQQAWLAEDVLCRLAGEHAPVVSLGEDETTRKTASAAWEKWWKENEEKVDLKKLKEKPPYLGLTVIAYQDNFGQARVMEMGKDGKTRWEFQGVSVPITDMQVLPNERVLLAEINGGRVTERNKKGEIIRQIPVQQPVACQRLANGNTVVGTQNNVYEYDAAGKQVFTYTRNRWDVMNVRKHRNGEYIMLTRTHMVRINGEGKEVGSWAIGRNFNYGSFDILPNGNVLIPLSRNNKVVEYKLDGTEVWSANINFPTSVQRLPNGNTLVTSMNYRTITELDKAGKQVSQTPLQGNPNVALRR
jgi:HEAT repeat protein